MLRAVHVVTCHMLSAVHVVACRMLRAVHVVACHMLSAVRVVAARVHHSCLIFYGSTDQDFTEFTYLHVFSVLWSNLLNCKFVDLN